MKVLRIIGGLDEAFGGPSVTSVNSAIAAQRLGIETHFAFPDSNIESGTRRAGAKRMREEGIQTIPFPFSTIRPEFSRSHGHSPELARWMLQTAHDYDILHAHSCWGQHTLAALWAAKRAHRPIVLSPHEGLTTFDMAQAKSPLLRLLKFPLSHLYRRFFDAIVFSSHLELRDSGKPYESTIQTALYHPAYDEQKHSLAPKAYIKPTDGIFKLGFLGRIHPKKNLDILLEALSRCPDHITLSIAGDGEKQHVDMVHKLASQLGIEKRLNWLGFISGDEKTAFLSSIDLLAMPSQYECFGMVAAEAMVAGTPVIVSSETGVAEAIKKNDSGFVIEPKDEEIAAILTGLSSNPEQLAELSRRCILTCEDNFSFRVHGKGLSELYSKLIDTKKQGKQ